MNRDAQYKRQIRMVCRRCDIAETRWTHLSRECKRCGSLMRHRTVTMAQRQRRASEPDTYPAPRRPPTREQVMARLARRFAVQS